MPIQHLQDRYSEKLCAKLGVAISFLKSNGAEGVFVPVLLATKNENDVLQYEENVIISKAQIPILEKAIQLAERKDRNGAQKLWEFMKTYKYEIVGGISLTVGAAVLGGFAAGWGGAAVGFVVGGALGIWASRTFTDCLVKAIVAMTQWISNLWDKFGLVVTNTRAVAEDALSLFKVVLVVLMLFCLQSMTKEAESAIWLLGGIVVFLMYMIFRKNK